MRREHFYKSDSVSHKRDCGVLPDDVLSQAGLGDLRGFAVTGGVEIGGLRKFQN